MAPVRGLLEYSITAREDTAMSTALQKMVRRTGNAMRLGLPTLRLHLKLKLQDLITAFHNPKAGRGRGLSGGQ